MGLRYRDLGSVGLDRDGASVKVPVGRLTTMLSVLLIHANHRVSTDALLDALWGDTVRGQNAQTLESHVLRLRKLLEPQHQPAQPYTTLLHNAQGYQLLTATDQVDSLWFEQLAGQARDLMVSGQPDRARSRCEQALASWRGRPWAPHTDAQWAAPAAARLDELRADVAYQRIDALLELGQIPLALADLEVLISATPLRERLWAQRMRGLHRAARTDEALHAYQRLRQLLNDELGVDPGSDIRELHARILADDPHLALSTTTGPSSQSVAVQPDVPANPGASEAAVRLPHRRTALIGREKHTADLAALINTRRLVSVVGTAGCGKTSIAIEAARHDANRFPDGVLFIDLSAANERNQFLDAVSSALRLPASAAETLTQSLVAFTRTRRMLLILDNCEQLLEDIAELVDALLGTDTELSILTTSREPLNLDDEQIFTLPPLPIMNHSQTQIADIDTLVDQPAIKLFLTRLKASAPDVAVGEIQTRLAAGICAAVDGVPLAIELAAAQARAYTLTEIMNLVKDDLAGLARIGRGPNRHHSSLRAAIDLSSATLSEDEMVMHQALSVVPGPVTPTLAAALVGQPVPAAAATLSSLLHRSMVIAVPPDQQYRPSRFAQLATIRSHARGTVAPRLRDQFENRRDAWVHELVAQVPRIGEPTETAWFEKVNDDLTALRATLQRRLIDDPDQDGVYLAARLGIYWYDHGMMAEWERWTRLAHTMTHPVHTCDQLLTGLSHGAAMALTGRGDYLAAAVDAIEHHTQEFTPAQQLAVGEALIAYGIGAWVSGDADVVIRAETICRHYAALTGDKILLLLADICRLGTEVVAGRAGPAELQHAQQLWTRAHTFDNFYASWILATWASLAAIMMGDPAAAQLWSARVLADYYRSGIGAVSMVLETHAAALTLNGHYQQAMQIFSASRSYARSAGVPWPLLRTTHPTFTAAANVLSVRDREQAERAGIHLTLDDVAHWSTPV